ncbi:MAG TPA: ADP/ATP-dependent (S)-NAD(P)H-hydrate dehydratase, partial [Phycisphaerae bacterium]|nr:ADP/ATP-dependent (S)-NAD(P)H-hydrate dehydratase [Phycisphaerae bacterium]
GAPIVLDADALNAIHTAHSPQNETMQWPHSGNFVVTPHPGEMARLCGTDTSDVQARREETAVRAAAAMIATRPSKTSIQEQDAQRGVVVLKGAQTIVTDGQRAFVNRTGNPGMATGGTGDVLTGVISGLLAQGLPRFDAAVLGVCVHGLAGDLAARSLGETSLIASDLLDYLPTAFRGLVK